MKRFLALCLALSLVLTLAPALGEEEKVLNIFSWEGYVDETTIANFTAETGISINYAVFASNEEMLMKLQANGASEYDIIIASDYILSLARKENLLLPLDKEQLTGWENINPAYLDQYFDPGNVYTMPYTVGVPMIVYDPARVAEPITSFDDLWREEFRDNLCLLDDARVMIGAVLKTLGYSYNPTAGEVVAGYLFTPDVVICQMENPDLVAVFPEEGIGFGIDSLAIPANAPHPQNAHIFLDYLLRPEVAAHVAEWQLYTNPNLAADPLISEETKQYAALNVPEELLATKEYVEDVGEYESVYQEIWMEFKLQ